MYYFKDYLKQNDNKLEKGNRNKRNNRYRLKIENIIHKELLAKIYD